MTSYQDLTDEEREARRVAYETDLAARQAAEAAAKDAALELAHGIAHQLGPDWAADWLRDVDGTPYGHGITITGPDAGLFVRRITYGAGAGRLEVSANPPAGTPHPRGTRPEITVSSTRTPQALAKDIERRILPDARAYWEAAKLEHQAKTDAENGQRAALVRLEAHGARGYAHELERFSVSNLPGHTHIRGHINHDGTRVNLDIAGLPLDTAAAVLELIEGNAR